MVTQTAEKSKNVQFSIESIIKKIMKYILMCDHPLQRESEQWDNKKKGNLIADILLGNPIPSIIIAEQVIVSVLLWLLDGKQRCTTFVNFYNNMFKLSKNIERYLIKYQAIIKDENGNVVFDCNGSPKYEEKECDIRGKYFKELPEELQERFLEYTVSCVKYLNCSDEDIEYHIRRYNSSKPMTAAQKGIMHIGGEYARVVKKIKEKDFFKNIGSYTTAERHNGILERVITESIMAINFLSDWSKRQEDICAYLKKNINVSHFDAFEEQLDRLSEIITDNESNLFNSKESFTWFALFDRFCKLEVEDEKFSEFLREFQETLHSKNVDGITYDNINSKSAKDKSVIVKKLDLLETLMNDYLHIKKEEIVEEFVIENQELKNFIEEFNGSDLARQINIQPNIEKVRIALQSLMMVCNVDNLSDIGVQDFIKGVISSDDIEDTLLYMDSLNDWSLDVNNSSKLFSQKNLPALVKMVGYTYKNEISDDVAIMWFKQYVENFDVNGKFGTNKYENYNSMVQSLDKYVSYVERKLN